MSAISLYLSYGVKIYLLLGLATSRGFTYTYCNGHCEYKYGFLVRFCVMAILRPEITQAHLSLNAGILLPL